MDFLKGFLKPKDVSVNDWVKMFRRRFEGSIQTCAEGREIGFGVCDSFIRFEFHLSSDGTTLIL